ncbi:hypothetical protein HYG84_10315 [Alkaliphilus sp. B6464]|nr:hypothetical protein [Alkaliphilus sp. B6464]QUH20260.1 hypothetical protein HYG84_10315 [Alkaliphilus sp. B6464]
MLGIKTYKDLQLEKEIIEDRIEQLKQNQKLLAKELRGPVDIAAIDYSKDKGVGITPRQLEGVLVETMQLDSMIYLEEERLKNTIRTIQKIDARLQQLEGLHYRRYGLYSRRRNKISKQIVHLYNFIKQMSIEKLLKDKKQELEKKKSWKERIIENFARNPLLCTRCKTEKILWKIWHKDYGLIYDIKETKNVEDISYESFSGTPLCRKIIQISLF